jgi:cytoskeletal protein CcmA (bactofilin family)
MKRKRNPASMDTIIGEHTTFKGDVESDSSIKVIGRVEGDINASGDVVILVNAVVIGNIIAENLVVAGMITGNVHIKRNLRLESTARLKGDMEVNSFVTDEGAVFEGNCKMVESVSDDKNDKKKNMNFKRSEPINTVIEEKEGI